jgi:hypothetical protein
VWLKMLKCDVVILHETTSRDSQPLLRYAGNTATYLTSVLICLKRRDLRCKDQPESKTRSEGHLSLKVCAERDAVADADADSYTSIWSDDLLLEVR